VLQTIKGAELVIEKEVTSKDDKPKKELIPKFSMYNLPRTFVTGLLTIGTDPKTVQTLGKTFRYVHDHEPPCAVRAKELDGSG
jgi:hypothetical protein